MRKKCIRKKKVIVNPKKYVVHKMDVNESDFQFIKLMMKDVRKDKERLIWTDEVTASSKVI